MSRFRTRTQLRERARRRAQRTSNTGVYTDANWNRTLAEAWGLVWFELTTYIDGYGLQLESGTAGSPTATVDMPTEFLALRGVARRVGTTADPQIPIQTTYNEALARGLLTGTVAKPGFYLLEGPAIDGATIINRRVKFLPSLDTNEQYDLVFTTQEPGLGDPDVPGDDTTSIDVIAEPVEYALTELARKWAVTRENERERMAAQKEAIMALQAFAKLYGESNRTGARALSAFSAQTGGHWIGYD